MLARKGDDLRRAGQTAAATAVFQAAIDLHPDAAAGYFGLGLIAVDRQDWFAAHTWLAQALAFDPDLPEAHSALARVLIEFGNYAEARAHLERAIALKPGSITAYLFMGDSYAREGADAAARDWYRRAAMLFPSSPEPDIRLALAAIAQAQPQAAFAALDDAGRKDPNSAQRYLVLARAFRLAGGPQSVSSALAALEQAVTLAPADPWGWVWLGDAYREVGRCSESQAAYARAAALDSGNVQVMAHQAVPCPLEATTRAAANGDAGTEGSSQEGAP
jgi:tetratricopeptide (TPR) repeat protein